MRRSRCAYVIAAALALTATNAFAQDASVASSPPVAAPGPVDPTAPMPPGHPPIDGAPQDPHGAIQRATVAESFSNEASDLPPGVLEVRVVNARGEPIPEVRVRVGSMRDGEPAGAQEVRTGPDGTARVERLVVSDGVAYRLSTEHEGARFGAPPFQLSRTAGQRVQIVRHEVTHSPRGILIWDARAEVRFKDDRAIVVVRAKIVNLTAMALGGAAAQPMTFVPTDGLRFGIPTPHTAFVTEPSMSDMRLTEDNGAALFRGSVPPTTAEPLEVVFQYQVKLTGGDVDFDMSMPLQVVSATVITEAPPGLTLSVAGMPAAQQQEGDGQRVLMTGVERRPDDPPIASLRVHLGGIPRAAGPSRTVAASLAALVTLATLAYAFVKRRGTSAKRSRAVASAERDRVLAEMAELARLRREGDVGPITYDRRRRELALWLAAILRELEAPSAGPA